MRHDDLRLQFAAAVQTDKIIAESEKEEQDRSDRDGSRLARKQPTAKQAGKIATPPIRGMAPTWVLRGSSA